MDRIYQERIVAPNYRVGHAANYRAGHTPNNTSRRRMKCLQYRQESSVSGYGTLKSRDTVGCGPPMVETPMKSYDCFEPHVTSTRNNSCIMYPAHSDPIRRGSDSSADICPIAPPCSVDGENEDEYSDDVFEDEPLPAIPPSLELQYFNCQLCDQVFYRRESLNNHLERHMLDMKSRDQKVTRHECKDCGKVYKEKAKLNMHRVKRHKLNMEIIMVL